ncbi:MAG: alkyl/aryl-sulfatase [Ilumatobacteraceae bacterium]
MTNRKPATAHTASRNSHDHGRSFDPSDEERARRGLIAQLEMDAIRDLEGRTVTRIADYDFLRGGDDSPATVNPHLWRHATLNANHGLFEVAPKVWQVRGYDISNITFIEGNTGWLIIDPLTNPETASASFGLVAKYLGERPVKAVIYTHSHVDHFGGVAGVISEEDATSGRCMIIAPEGFMHETVGENVIAGPAMARRAAYQFGALLPPGPDAHVDAGLGTAAPVGAPSLFAPTHDITATGEEMVVDGVRIVFQLTPETEAPAEMNFFFPDFGWLCMAENCSHTMHNLVPIRGAQVRNSLNWSKYINEAIEMFADRTEVLFTSHSWPRWGEDDVRGFLTLQRDLYRWMHDQSMRLANKGMTPLEIAEQLELPDEFKAHEHTRGFYGDLVHNAKAVYQRYLSWYDGNPANLHKLPPTEVGSRYVQALGGAEQVLSEARRAFAEGDYRWVAELLNHLVFSDPDNDEARQLQADTFEQLGYQAESATFRNAYLTGAQELRQGKPKTTKGVARARSLIKAMSIEQTFDTIALRVKSEEMGGVSVAINWTFTDLAGADDHRWVMGISNRVLFATRGRHDSAAAAHVSISRSLFLDVLSQVTTFMDELGKGTVVIEGDAGAMLQVFGNLDAFESGFAIVEP